jgi:protein SCO1/2
MAGANEKPSSTDPEAAIAYSQAAVGRQIGDFTLVDPNGRDVHLAEYRGRPLVINLVYTSCNDTCPTVVETLYRAVSAAQDALGADSFAIATIGFDAAHDSPSRMRAYATSHGISLPNWRFLSAEADTIERLTDKLGFIFFESPQGFDHLAQISVVDANGRIYRHVYGADFEVPALVEPLKDLVFGRGGPPTSIAGIVDRIRLFCTIYDPASGRYRFDYSIFASILGTGLGLLAVGFVLVRAILRLRRREASGLLQ